MPIPAQHAPEFNTRLPSTGKKVTLRAFLVKDQKILLIAKETNNSRQQVVAMLQVLKNCMVSDVDVNKIPSFDVEFLFLQLINNSMGRSFIPITHICKNMIVRYTPDGEKIEVECNHENMVKIKVGDVKIDQNKIKDGLVELSPNFALQLDYFSFNTILEDENLLDNDAVIDVRHIAETIRLIKADGDILKAGIDFTIDEATEMLESLDLNAFKKIEEFFKDYPTLEHQQDITCPECGNVYNLHMRGFDDFFIY